jgi:hypothetical protein
LLYWAFEGNSGGRVRKIVEVVHVKYEDSGVRYWGKGKA